MKSSFEATALAELPVLYRIAKRMTLNPILAEDLVGQTLLQAAKFWHTFDGAHPRSWMIRIMQNIHVKGRSKLASRRSNVLLDSSVTDEDIWIEIDRRLLASRIVEELDKISDEYRMAVTLCDMEELSYEEAADALGIPIGTVRSRLFRGRRILRQRLAGMVDPERLQI